MPSGICQDPGGFAPVVGMYHVRTLALARAPERNTIQNTAKTWLGAQDQIY